MRNMQLSEYLKVKQMTQTELARKLGVSDPYLSRILNGDRTASLEFADRLTTACEGRVTMAELLAEIAQRRQMRKAS